MESQNGLGRELLWGLLACQSQLVSREALADAVQAWLSVDAIPLSQVFRDLLGLDPDRVARIDSLTSAFLRSRDSSPLHSVEMVALGDVLDGLLEHIDDPRARSSLQDAALTVGIPLPLPASLTVGVLPGGLTRLIKAGSAAGQDEPGGAKSLGTGDPESTDVDNPTDHQTTMSSTEREPVANPPPHDPAETMTHADDATQDAWPPRPPGDEQGNGQSRVVGERVATMRYRIIRPHAEGGLGAVFVAHDEELHREVALKEILERHAHISENRLRFLLEAEVTGGLEHPGIVPVHGLGQYDDGRPYYAMRFIRGNSLKAAVASFHAADCSTRDPSERALSIRRLLSHFVDVCDAIAYAHSRGVLHRDLKPANIMLGKFGETLVVDWGLAKPLLRCFPQNDEPPPPMLRTVLDPAGERTLTLSGDEVSQPPASTSPSGDNDTLQERPLIPPSLGKSSETLAGTRVGTPAFMSPEQAAGHVDRLGPASDIYSLGATLYNILTGKPPFTGSDLSKTLLRVTEGDFPPPRQANSSVPRPLEAIVLKAMALKPDERYVSPKALREDIEHWMADEPVSAYPDPLLARLARWARRHKTSVAASAAILLAAVVGLTAGSAMLERERARTDRERALAVKNYGYAYEAAETMLGRVGDVDLADIPQMEPVRLELLETAKLQFHKLLEQRSNDPEVLLLEDRTRARLGDVLEMMGQYEDAEKNYREAIDSLQALERRLPDDDRPLRARARAEHGLGVLLRKLNRFREAESWLREAVRLRQQLVDKSPDDREAGQALSDSRYYLGALLARLASPNAEDRKLYDQAIKDQEDRLNLDPANAQNHIRLARYLNNLAILESRSDPAKAEQALRRVLDLIAGLDPVRAALPGARWQAARASNNLATLLGSKRRNEEAEPILKRARDTLDRLAAEFPQILQYRRELASIFNNLGNIERDTNQNDRAAEAYRQGVTHLESLAQGPTQVPDYRQNIDIALFQLALLKAGSDPAAAEGEIASILADQEKLIAAHPSVPDYRSAVGRNLLQYGRLLYDRGDSTQASPLVEKALARFEEALKEDPGNRAYGKNVTDALTLQILIAAQEKKCDRVSALAERLIQAPTADLRNYLTAAICLTRCLVLTTTSDVLSAEVRQERADAYGRRAVEILRQAVDRGLLNASDPLKDQEFLPLRPRADFIELFKELRDRQGPVAG
jgi:eukaryotic-like serine/threonine-protein kinase